MLYLDYAKPLTGGKYILNFFAESIEDLDRISHGQRFITKNGTDYGVPQPSSTVVITMPDKTKKTYVLNEAGEWQEGGVDMDYSKLENAPIILANLADKEFIPEANTYYEHLGETTEDFIKGIIYLYDGKEYKAIDGSGSGAGVQSDYNQNDSAAADYIKNRPFYEETKTGLAEVFNETLAFEWDETSNSGLGGKEYEGGNPMGKISVGTAMTVIFNGVEYSGTTQDLPDGLKEEIEAMGFTGFVFGASMTVGDDWAPTAEFPFGILYYGNDDYEGQAVAVLAINTSIKQASIPVIIKVKATVTEIHTIDPKFIKDMYYETTNTETLLEQTFTTTTVDNINFWATNTSFISFVKGDTVTINYKGTKYTQEVKELNTVLYVGNLALGGLSPATNEPFLIANIYYPDGLSKLTPGITVATSEAQTDANIKVYKSVQNVHTIEPKYIKDMYYEETGDGEKTLVFKGEIDGLTDESSSLFTAGDMVSLKEDSIGLNVTDYAKEYTTKTDGTSQTLYYIGNLSILELDGVADTKEDYCLACADVGSFRMLLYTNKNKKAPNNIEVYKSAATIVRIPEKYLPLDIAKKSYVDTAISDAITKTLNTEV